MMEKLAVVFGAGGQDGSYLCELLLQKEYHVVAVVRRSSVDNTVRLSPAQGNKHFEVIEGDVADATSVINIIHHFCPTECYNLAAMSHVGTSFLQPRVAFDVNANGVLNILEAIRLFSPKTRMYQASTSELFGNNISHLIKGVNFDVPFQYEKTPFSPRSPYAVAKLAGHYLVQTYRESYGLHASCGILFNHESPRRGENFVTRKITKYVAKLVARHDAGLVYPKLSLGNLDAKRDWGFAGDYVEAMWAMLQKPEPDDYVIATGESHSVREFCQLAFARAGIEKWEDYIFIDPKLYRPAEVNHLLGYAGKAREKLGWTPKVLFKELVNMMVDADTGYTPDQDDIETLKVSDR